MYKISLDTLSTYSCPIFWLPLAPRTSYFVLNPFYSGNNLHVTKPIVNSQFSYQVTFSRS